jgi:hypothetical protein
MAYQPKKYSSDFYRDQMLNLIQSRSAGVLKEKRKMERMQEDAEKEQSGKWGDVAMLGASLGGMIGSAVGPAGTGIGMGIGAGAGALLGGIRGLAGGARGKDFIKGAVPSPIAAATGMSSMAQTLAAERARTGRDYLPRTSGFDRSMAMTQAMAPIAGMAMRGFGGAPAGPAGAGAGLPPPPAGGPGIPSMSPTMSMGMDTTGMAPAPSVPLGPSASGMMSQSVGSLPPPAFEPGMPQMGPAAGLESGPSLQPTPSPMDQFTMLQPGMLGQPAQGLPGLASGIYGPRY